MALGISFRVGDTAVTTPHRRSLCHGLFPSAFPLLLLTWRLRLDFSSSPRVTTDYAHSIHIRHHYRMLKGEDGEK